MNFQVEKHRVLEECMRRFALPDVASSIFYPAEQRANRIAESSWAKAGLRKEISRLASITEVINDGNKDSQIER
jgi:hypothetical protein